jgi:hypothetical protein
MFRKLTIGVVVVAVAASVAIVAGHDSGAGPAKKVDTAPVITKQPASATTPSGKTAHFSVTATGTPKPTYQWQVSADGGPFVAAGSSSASLKVTASAAVGGNLYRVVVSNSSGTVTSQDASLTVAPSTKDADVKPLIDGLIDKGSQASYDNSEPFPVTPTAELNGYATAFAGIVVNDTWAQLEPSKGQWDLTPLDQSLAAVSAYNAANPSDPLHVKLRIWGGFTAPNWAKSLDGTPITVAADANGDNSGTLGRYWLSDYQQQWTSFQKELAKTFDNDALVSEVAVTSCNTASGEPFVMTANVIEALLAAGWTSADQQSCLDGALGNYAAWHHTAVDFTFNLFSDISSSGTRSPDPAFTDQVMTQCAESETTGALPECILDNHGLTDTVTTQQTPVYGEIDTLWQQYDGNVPVDFQTDSPNGFNLCEAVGIGVSYHAQSIEIWPPGVGFPGFDEYTPAQLTAWDQALAAGTQPTCD